MDMFLNIAVLLVVAASFGILAKLFKQPLIVGYLFSGIFLSATGLLGDTEVFESFGTIGVTLLLFLLGLEMNIRELPVIGKVAVITGLGQIIFTSLIGFILATILGFDTLPAVYISIGLTFSSTIIIVKLLSEKKSLASLYGKIAVGFLLVQDFVALIILMLLVGLGNGNLSGWNYLFILLKAIFLFGLVWFLSKKVLSVLFERIVGNSHELLFVVSIAWAIGFAAFLAGPMDFTPEIGGFLAGLSLAGLPAHLHIASKTRPLRDFFLVIFFMLLGTKLVVGGDVFNLIPHAIIFSLFVLIGNPIIVLIIMGVMGFKRRTSFMAGLTVAQISEFSLIVANMGLMLGHITSEHVALIVMVGVITMTISTYLILGSDKLYNKIYKQLAIFERKKTKELQLVTQIDKSNHIVLVGADSTGTPLAMYFKHKKMDFVVVDFNPNVYERFTKKGIPTVFGDINDSEILTASGIVRARIVISTISDLASDLTLLIHIKKENINPVVIMSASSTHNAQVLYENGASYVVVPDVVSGEHIRHMLTVYGNSPQKFRKIGKNHLSRLKKKQ
ncbi:cation:proton antiporter [Candidatus Woesebacteria bacterium]|nr:MAG: cation:proton antiporter [Candidatus Woesebacteria bacterium]